MSGWRWRPLWHLTHARLLEFYRTPPAVFWVHGFPLVVLLVLGWAFRERPVERLPIGLATGPIAPTWSGQLAGLEVIPVDAERGEQWLRAGRLSLLLQPSDTGYRLLYDPNRPDAAIARGMLRTALLPPGEPRWEEVPLSGPGSRYVDFLVPGLLAVGLLGGGLAGVGFVAAELRLQGRLRAYLATPMRKEELLAALVLARFLTLVPETLLVLGVAWIVFAIPIRGSALALTLVLLAGAAACVSLGLLLASRARTIESVTGWVSLAMLAQWVLCGVFFPIELFPASAQPWLAWLPLTPAVTGLRQVLLEGGGLMDILPEVGRLVVWTVSAGTLAIWWFRWS